MGPGLFVTEHCLTRGFNETATRYLNSSAIAKTMSQSTFERFTLELEGSPDIAPDHRAHDGGHVAVGGEMSNFFSSPGGKQIIYRLLKAEKIHFVVKILFSTFTMRILTEFGGTGKTWRLRISSPSDTELPFLHLSPT